MDARSRVAEARVGRLATIDPDGRPNVVPFVFVLEGDTLYSVVDDKPKRSQRLRRGESIEARPDATVLVDHHEDEPPINGIDDLDATVDASLLGLAWRFRAVEPDSARMVATAAAIRQRLTLRDGGLLRYKDDTYAGGNAWIVTTLWLGLRYRQVGDAKGFDRCLPYAIKRQTNVGLLPEQVARDGNPWWFRSPGVTRCSRSCSDQSSPSSATRADPNLPFA